MNVAMKMLRNCSYSAPTTVGIRIATPHAAPPAPVGDTFQSSGPEVAPTPRTGVGNFDVMAAKMDMLRRAGVVSKRLEA